jgi:hypothetical protein
MLFLVLICLVFGIYRPDRPRHVRGYDNYDGNGSNRQSESNGRVKTPRERREALLAEFERSGMSGQREIGHLPVGGTRQLGTAHYRHQP